MTGDPLTKFWRSAAQLLLGGFGLALLTFVCFQLQLNLATTAFVYMIVIVLLSLMDSFISSAIFSVVAVICLNFFFVEPLYTFRVADPISKRMKGCPVRSFGVTFRRFANAWVGIVTSRSSSRRTGTATRSDSSTGSVRSPASTRPPRIS